MKLSNNKELIRDNNYQLSIGNATLLCIKNFLLLILITLIDVIIWSNLSEGISSWLNIVSTIILNILFFTYIENKLKADIKILKNISIKGILLAIGCSILFYFLLDKFLDPIFEGFFPVSEKVYQESINDILKNPICGFLSVCIIAPITEELLMRGYVLGGLKNKYGEVIAVMVSATLFGIMHFNMVQTLSACLCGLILGLLYIKTDSLFCCILCHGLYNTISFLTLI